MTTQKKRTICVVTGTRAEYGLLYWLMREIHSDPDLQLQIVATGMHLSPEFGLTYKIIEEDGFVIDAKVEMLLSSDTPVGIAKSVGLGVIGFADVFSRLQPDIIVLLGDRFETLASAEAALIARIPIAHIHGGETTEGVIDEAIRHSITKMSHLHFVAAEPYRRRVIQLGEAPDRVFNFGAIGLDNIKKLTLLTRGELESSIHFTLGILNFLVTYHPVTLNSTSSLLPIQELLAALEEFPQAKIIFTKANADTDGRVINRMIEKWVQGQKDQAMVTTSLGQLRYLSMINHVDIIIGNSSSGLIEVPSFKKPTVNLGNRQAGRLKASSVIDSLEKKEDIIASIKKALSEDFQRSLSETISPYGEGDTSLQIKDTLKNSNTEGILMKTFYDLESI